MARATGRELIIKIGNGDSPETFSNLCGLLARSFNLSTNEIETTQPDCSTPGAVVQRTVIAGVRTQTFTGTAYFNTGANSTAILNAARNGTAINAQVFVPLVGTFEGSWYVTNMSFSGEIEGLMTYDVTFSAASELTFTSV